MAIQCLRLYICQTRELRLNDYTTSSEFFLQLVSPASEVSHVKHRGVHHLHM